MDMIKIDWLKFFYNYHPLGFYTNAMPDWGRPQPNGKPEDLSFSFHVPPKYSVTWSWACFKRFEWFKRVSPNFKWDPGYYQMRSRMINPRKGKT